MRAENHIIIYLCALVLVGMHVQRTTGIIVPVTLGQCNYKYCPCAHIRDLCGHLQTSVFSVRSVGLTCAFSYLEKKKKCRKFNAHAHVSVDCGSVCGLVKKSKR